MNSLFQLWDMNKVQPFIGTWIQILFGMGFFCYYLKGFHFWLPVMYINVKCALNLDLPCCTNLCFLSVFICSICYWMPMMYTMWHGLLPTCIVSEWCVLDTFHSNIIMRQPNCDCFNGCKTSECFSADKIICSEELQQQNHP